MSVSHGDPEDLALTAISEGLVALHTRYYGRAPRRVQTRWMGPDLIACLMGEIYTNVEKTMIELQRVAIVRETRTDFQNATRARFVGIVEAATERTVTTFVSTFHVGPDLELELFFLETPA